MLRKGLLALILLAVLPAAVAGLKEGELNEDLTNPGSIELPAWFKNSFMDIAEDIAEATAENKRLVLYFHQDGCPYCKKLIEVNFTQQDIVDKARATVDILAINMWGDREVTWLDGETMSEKAFAKKMRVMFTPTMLFARQVQGGAGVCRSTRRKEGALCRVLSAGQAGACQRQAAPRGVYPAAESVGRHAPFQQWLPVGAVRTETVSQL